MDKKMLDRMLKEQERLGHPDFKNKIVDILVNRHSISVQVAKKTVFHSVVTKKMDQDMNWAQHMGPDFWANEIINHDLLEDF